MRSILLGAIVVTLAAAHPAAAQVAATVAPSASVPAAAPVAPRAVHAAEPAMQYAAAPAGVSRPPTPWAASDPADSLYRVARETLNRAEYRRAAQLFREVRDRYPRSEYLSEAAYWEAFALYRVGTTEDLRNALRILDQQRSYSRKQTQVNADALSARVLGALARRGDADAERRVAQAAQSGSQSCDQEDLMVRVEALNALSQLDQEAAMPLLRRVLERRDACSATLRQSAVTMVARRGGTGALALLNNVALSDPSAEVRTVATVSIARIETDEAAATLEGLMRAPDAEVRKTVAIGIARRADPRSRRLLRSYIESAQTPEAHRAEAVYRFQKESSSAEDVTFLRTLFGRTDSEQIRHAIVTVVPRLAPDEGRQWLMTLARDPNQPAPLRSVAINAIGRDTAVPVAELGRMYDVATERQIREQVVGALGRRAEPEATEKLIDIARNGTDPVVRRSAIAQLSRKKDPRLATLIQELVDR